MLCNFINSLAGLLIHSIADWNEKRKNARDIHIWIFSGIFDEDLNQGKHSKDSISHANDISTLISVAYSIFFPGIFAFALPILPIMKFFWSTGGTAVTISIFREWKKCSSSLHYIIEFASEFQSSWWCLAAPSLALVLRKSFRAENIFHRLGIV